MGPLLSIDATPLDGNDVDAEGLAVDGQGRAFVSFEAFHRVRRYDDIAGPAKAVPSDPSFARLSYNSGLESLALDAGDRLYTIPERSGALDRPFPVLRLDGLRWTRIGGVPRRGISSSPTRISGRMAGSMCWSGISAGSAALPRGSAASRSAPMT